MFWGFSEAIDLHEEYTKYIGSSPESLNILIFGCCDPRNILMTLAKSFKHNVKLNFYVLDGVIEVVARNMLLLSIAFESAESLALKSKTHLFMDVYGNTLLRPSSYNYLVSKAEFLKKVVTDPDKLEELAPIFNIDNLKYRERDALEETFNFWLPKEEHIFNIKQYWERRLRNMLGVRYDHRDGVFDWDLQMKLKDNEAKQICSQEYKHWRNTGVAFTFPEYEQCQPNKTLVAGLARNGTKYIHRGYVGDVEVGPYSAFGLKSSEEHLSKSFHGTNVYRSTDVTERNLFQILFEIQEKCEYTHNEKNTHKYGGAYLDLGKSLPGCYNEDLDLEKFDQTLIPMPNAKIFFLSLDDILGIQSGLKYSKFFDVVFIACNYFDFLKREFLNVFKDESLILFETKLLSVCKKEVINEFLEKIKTYAKDLNLKNLTHFNVNLKYSVVKFKSTNAE